MKEDGVRPETIVGHAAEADDHPFVHGPRAGGPSQVGSGEAWNTEQERLEHDQAQVPQVRTGDAL
jgi:hypothetical protein